MKLSEWLDEYRNFDPAGVERTASEPVNDWEEQELLAPADRVRDTTPRWRLRAKQVGLGRVTQL